MLILPLTTYIILCLSIFGLVLLAVGVAGISLLYIMDYWITGGLLGTMFGVIGCVGRDVPEWMKEKKIKRSFEDIKDEAITGGFWGTVIGILVAIVALINYFTLTLGAIVGVSIGLIFSLWVRDKQEKEDKEWGTVPSDDSIILSSMVSMTFFGIICSIGFVVVEWIIANWRIQ